MRLTCSGSVFVSRYVRSSKKAAAPALAFAECRRETLRAEYPAAFCRLNMSFCLVHNVALVGPRHWTNLIA
jgi:hypothetical protein